MSSSMLVSSGDESSNQNDSTNQQITAVKRRKGAQSTDYHFTDAQEEHLCHLMVSFEKQVNKLDPEWKGHCAPLTAWKKNAIESLLSHELFRDLVQNGGLSIKKWQDVFGRKFSNHFNNNMKRKGRRPLATSAISATPIPLLPVVESSPSTTVDDGKLLRKVLRAFIIFSGESPAREVFAQEMAGELALATQKLRNANPRLPAGAARNKALKEMWDAADQMIWDGKAEALANDIDANQKEFPGLIYSALNGLCNRGRLGSLITMFAFAYRRPDDDVLQTGIFSNGFDSYTQTEIKHEYSETFIDGWVEYAENQVPHKPFITKSTIPQDTTGLPIFPYVDIKSGVFAQYVQVVKDYLTELWNFCWSSAANIPQVPWVDITIAPEKYYDTNRFIVPVALQNPDDYDDPVEILLLIKFFSRQTHDNLPFQFRQKEEITLLTTTSLMEDAHMTHTASILVGGESSGSNDNSASPSAAASPALSPNAIVVSSADPEGSSAASSITKLPEGTPTKFISITPTPIDPASNITTQSNNLDATTTTPPTPGLLNVGPTGESNDGACIQDSSASATRPVTRGRGRGNRGRGTGRGRGRGKLSAAHPQPALEVPNSTEISRLVPETPAITALDPKEPSPAAVPIAAASAPISATGEDSRESRRSGRKRKAPTDPLHQSLQPPAKRRAAKDRWEIIIEPMPPI